VLGGRQLPVVSHSQELNDVAGVDGVPVHLHSGLGHVAGM
jgi:hypothetical protein